MKTFDEDLLQSYYNNKQFGAAADYYESLLKEGRKENGDVFNGEQKRFIRGKISQLRRDEAIQNATLANATDEEKEAYKFYSAINGGQDTAVPVTKMYDVEGNLVERLPYGAYLAAMKDITKGNLTSPNVNRLHKNAAITTDNNRFGDSYMTGLNSLKLNNGESVKYIGLELQDDEALQEIQQYLGIDDIRKNNLGIKYNNLGNGKHAINVSTENNNLYKLLKIYNEWQKSGLGAISWSDAAELLTSTGAGAMAGSFLPGVGTLLGGGTGLTVGLGDLIHKAYNHNTRVRIAAAGADGKPVGRDEFDYKTLDKIYKNINKAENLYNDVMSRTQEQQPYTSPISINPYLGAGHARAAELLEKGYIDRDQYKFVVEEWKKAYDNLIIGTNMADPRFEVYAYDALQSGEGKVARPVDNADIPLLQEEIKMALKDKRVDYMIGIKDGELGTYISITADYDTKTGEMSTGFSKTPKEIFIKGLFNDSATELYNKDTKSKAIKEMSDMQHWNYEKKLERGETIGHAAGIGHYVKTYDDRLKSFVKTPIGEDQVLQLLNENAIIENTLDELIANMTPDGKLMPRKNNKGEWFQPNLETVIENMAIAATNELHPKGTMNDIEREVYKTNLYQEMLDLLQFYTGVNFNK